LNSARFIFILLLFNDYNKLSTVKSQRYFYFSWSKIKVKKNNRPVRTPDKPQPHGMGDLYAAQTVCVGFHSFQGEGASHHSPLL
jgi:hypothetical protein